MSLNWGIIGTGTIANEMAASLLRTSNRLWL